MNMKYTSRLGSVSGSLAFGLLVLLPLGVGCGGSGTPPPLAAIPGPNAETFRVKSIRPGDTGWIRLADMYIDENGIAWVDSEAPVYRKSDPLLDGLGPLERAFIGSASGYLHVSLNRELDEMSVNRSRPRESLWLPARNLGAVVQAIRGGHQEIALPHPEKKDQSSPGS